MDRLTEWTGYEWIARQERLKGKVVTDRDVYNKLAEYEDIGMTADEIKYFLRDFGISQAMEIRELKKNNVKRLVLMLSNLKYPDELWIYGKVDLLWHGYINEKQVYKCLEDKEVVELYLGVDGLIAKID